MSNQVYIDMLNEVKAHNNTDIAESNAIISGIDYAITDLNNQITNLQTSKTEQQDLVAEYTDQNSTIDNLITFLSQ